MGSLIDQFLAALPPWLQSLLFLFLPLFNHRSRLAWFYGIVFIAIALGSYWFSQINAANRSWKNALAYCFPKSLYTSHSGILDWQCYVINGSFKIIIDLTLLASLSTWIARFFTGALDLSFGSPNLGLEINSFVIICHTIIGILVLDFSAFLSHYWLHKVPLLWEFHKVHHSAKGLTPITGFRDHPMDVVFKKSLRALLLGIYLGGFNYLTHSQVDIITIGGLLASTFLFNFTINLRHSHIWISYGYFLEHILCSPAMHQIHHSQREIHFDKNFSLIFSFWDYLFGSLYIPRVREEFDIGIPGQQDYQNIWELYYRPFTKAYELVGSSLNFR
jgi:sterol desaturase/sphingolipid hydroxylase (fatty acid hydroxylase superfamily)